MRLRVDVAARYEDYRDIEGVIAPKVGLVYEPFSSLALKGTWGRSFKAPTLFQEFQPRQGPLLPSSFFVGAPATVREKLSAIIAASGADEVMVTSAIYDHEARKRSYALLAKEFGLAVSG